MRTRSMLIGLAMLASPLRAAATPAPNVVTDWSAIVQQAIHNAGAPRSAGSSQILHATVMVAVYDAVIAIQGGYRPFIATLAPVPYADVRAAVATAAYRTARARVAPSQVSYLDQQYTLYLANIPGGIGKSEGVRIGEAAASAVLAARADDRFNTVVAYECSSTEPPAGEYEPDAGCPTGPTSQPVDAKVGRIVPFSFVDVGRYLPDGPDPLTSSAYAEDFAETRDLGRNDSTFRTPEQTDIAYFWSENPYVHWNRNLMALATQHGLDVRETARLFAMVHVAVSDAVIVGFAAKYYYAFWRPRTAIPRADTDGNPDTDADPTWKPLLMVNHPEYPSGHGFWSTALLDTVAAFFGTNKVTWTLTTSRTAVPALVQAERTYDQLNALNREIGNARIWGGLHWRHSIQHGSQVGRRVAAHINRNYFEPIRRR
ncbi:MAG TPA: vanadium-dependent haloperoxidase [Luteitalea sp.]|nr:vanadium-dependent haloperoxidase [Luteitalea sp.]